MPSLLDLLNRSVACNSALLFCYQLPPLLLNLMSSSRQYHSFCVLLIDYYYWENPLTCSFSGALKMCIERHRYIRALEWMWTFQVHMEVHFVSRVNRVPLLSCVPGPSIDFRLFSSVWCFLCFPVRSPIYRYGKGWPQATVVHKWNKAPSKCFKLGYLCVLLCSIFMIF